MSGMEMTKKTPFFSDQFKMADFLLGVDHRCQRLLCVSGQVTRVYRISCSYSKKSPITRVF